MEGFFLGTCVHPGTNLSQNLEEFWRKSFRETNDEFNVFVKWHQTVQEDPLIFRIFCNLEKQVRKTVSWLMTPPLKVLQLL